MTEYGFHPDASQEYTDAIHYYYNEVHFRLADEFISEVESSILAIRRNSKIGRIVENNVRRYLVHRFPYGIYYTCENGFVTIWAVMHLSRKPGYWRKRKP